MDFGFQECSRIWPWPRSVTTMCLGKTLNSHSACLPRCVNRHWKILFLGVTLWWTSISSKWSRNTPSHIMVQKPRYTRSLLISCYVQMRTFHSFYPQTGRNVSCLRAKQENQLAVGLNLHHSIPHSPFHHFQH